MKLRRLSPLALALIAVIVPGVPLAMLFFDEVASLKAELAQWQEVHEEADFTDVIEQLDDLAGTTFTDVDDLAWFAPYVSSLAEWGIVSGYKDAQGKTTGAFGPGDPVTVAEVLKMAVNAARVDTTECSPPTYTAEANSHWAKDYVGCAEELRARLFAPSYGITLNRPARRAEVLAIMHDVAGDSVPALFASFIDTQGHRFESDIAYASQLNVVSGDTDASGAATGTFRPDDAVNRAEAAKIIYQKIKEQAKQDVL